ncbi:MAG TPA: Flp family type IVb pilin [Dehalococcoidia bacterium]|jgi:Flp pilus assembly pilin Flp|nr:Flp family type IVb pilin [Dehalococcoidia bacterium]
MRWLLRLLERAGREAGQTLVEYALIIAMVAIALVLSLQVMGTGLMDIYADIAAAIP